MDDSLTQGCSIEWADGNDTETPGKSTNLNALFRSPTPRSNRSSKSTETTSKMPGSASTTASTSPNLGTQPILKSAEKKEKRVEDEVDYIFSVLEHNSNDEKAKAFCSESSKSICENAKVQDDIVAGDTFTPKVDNVQNRIGANELNAMLSGLDTSLSRRQKKEGTSTSQMAGTNQRRKRREIMERTSKRLFRSSNAVNRNESNQKRQSGHSQKSKQEISTSNFSSFDDLLLDLKETPNGKDAMPKVILEEESRGNQSALVPPMSKRKIVEPIATHQKSSTVNLLDDQFDDIDFDDNLFAAMDAAVQQRQKQTLCNPYSSSASQSQGSRGAADGQSSAPANVLSRSPTLPISNKSADVVQRQDSSKIHIADMLKEPIVLVPPSNVANNPIEDDFADFPIMDFDEIDQLVAHRNIAKENESKGVEYISCTRYRICSVMDNTNLYSKTLSVALWKESNFNLSVGVNDLDATVKVAGNITLCGEWYHTRCEEGDVMHLCSLSGKHNTEVSALPISLQTTGVNDDLVMILHPDQLVTPTTISETVGCLRRAILKTRYGSGSFTGRSAMIGSMRHSLFERCLLQNNFTREFAQIEAPLIVREFGEQLVGAGLLNEREVTLEVIRMLPNIQKFAAMYTNFTENDGRGNMVGVGHSPSIDICAERIHATEEFAVSTELGIKGFIDATVEVSTRPPHGVLDYMKQVKPTTSLMGVELKTGHNQTPQHGHMAQLVLYTMALRTRYGSSIANGHSHGEKLVGAGKGGMLLYLNQTALNAVHVSPEVSELKSLLSQRNVVAAELRRAAAPRGVVIEYDKEEGSEKENKRIIKILPATPAALPDLLSHSHSCERCYSNRECMLNAAVENVDSTTTYGSNKSHASLLQHFTGHLDHVELDYLKNWDRMIDLEASVSNREITKSWLKSSSDLERSLGTTISSLTLDEGTLHDCNQSVVSEVSEFIIKCNRLSCNSNEPPLNSLKFEVGSRGVLSTDGVSIRSSLEDKQQFGLARATVKSIDEQSIYIQVNHADFLRISRLGRSKISEGSPHTFRLDKENFMTGTSTLRQNLMNLFTSEVASFPTKSAASQETATNTLQRGRSTAPLLRRSIIHLDAPRFDSLPHLSMFASSSTSHLSNEFSLLNEDQKAAVYKVVTAKNYSIIQGFPGTGKTSTIVFIARLMMAMGKRVLVTSYTHSAVDNILLKLVGGSAHRHGSYTTDVVRVGRKHSVHPALHRYLTSDLASEMDQQEGLRTGSLASDGDTNADKNPSIANLHKVISSAKVVGVSALTVPKSPLLIGQKFDLVIVDEAGQISQPAIIGALLAAESFVLVGDHEQLPPLVQSDVAEKAGYSISMLKRLADEHPNAVAQLTLQYRMHEDICLLPNLLVYKGGLKCANDDVKSKKLRLNSFPRSLKTIIKPNNKGLGWLLPVLNPNKPVVFVNTDNIGQDLEFCGKGGNRSSSRGLVNDTELELSRFVVNGLLVCGLPPSSVGIISPYRAQVNRISDDPYIKSTMKDGLEVSTVDRYQGKDKDVVILSFARSNSSGKTGRLLEDKRRLNVALSRAKMKLIVIGSYDTLLAGSSVLKSLLQEMKDRSWVESPPNNAAQIYNAPC